MSYRPSRLLGRRLAAAAVIVLLAACRAAGAAPTGSGGSAMPLEAASEAPSPTATTSPSATASPTDLPSESPSPTASSPPTLRAATPKPATPRPVKTPVPTPSPPPTWDPNVGYSISWNGPVLSGGTAKLTLHLGVPATCSFNVTYQNLGTTSLGTATAVWNGKWGADIAYDVSRTWTVPGNATGTATVAWSCSYAGTVKANSINWTVDVPPTPTPTPVPSWAIGWAMYPTYPGGMGHLSVSSFNGAGCTLKVSYLDGTTQSINFTGSTVGSDVTWTVPTSVPTGTTPFLITCTYSGTTHTASDTFAINPPPSPSP